ncbi:CDGSH iron-sulfur domain-containing protein [Phenylobacterium montanum]|uniref:CDGSH iron-sulfur domain-containing protein n=1 Tax=Phenylobacterium montanum TaxID=2823693 RepID=A0A975G3N2_9CAUL|nr:CDGSH iron-sulfur domain-containing protein [Caulobacter sp. S6]QUD90280.1 CDGSH iron-sulfur domain-containing protein [Caulobacter sp. S6]
MTIESTPPEIATGQELEIRFDSNLCIHARFCVLSAPDVFKANTPGEWIYPDAMNAPALAAVARNCPSGAITYRAADPVLEEPCPPVNLLRIRQDGPYAFNAQIVLAGETEPSTRRTLCRCGASNNKPYCDGSHVRVGFEATGEPPAGDRRPLSPRDGPLEVTPLRDGPLEVRGPLEMVSGTGRTFATSVHCLLCRCGCSSSKPYCDGTHASNGFTDRNGCETLAASSVDPAPSLAEWAGGREAFVRLTEAFYAKVPNDPLLALVFAHMPRDHAVHVADFIAEVFGGPTEYSGSGGSHTGMIRKHLGRAITDDHRRRWVELMIATADEAGLPTDPAFRDAFVAYLEWGSRLAVINSAPGVPPPEGDWPMPAWGWGPPRGPG